MSIVWLLIIIVAVCASLILLRIKSSALVEKLTVFIACLSLLISLGSVFKSRIMPFHLQVLTGGNLLMCASGNIKTTGLPIVVSCTFINNGLRAGSIEQIAMKVTDSNDTVHHYVGLGEIDFRELIRGMRKLHADNFNQVFIPFQLQPHEAVVKHILFVEQATKKYPMKSWQPGDHRFEIYTKTSNSTKPNKVDSFNYKLDEKQFTDLKNDTSIHISLRENFDI